MKYALLLCRGLCGSPSISDMTGEKSFPVGNAFGMNLQKWGLTRYSLTNNTDLTRILYTMLGNDERHYCSDEAFSAACLSVKPDTGDVCIECSFGTLSLCEDGETELISRCDDLSPDETKVLFEILSEAFSNSVFEFSGTIKNKGYIVWRQGDSRGTGIAPLGNKAVSFSDYMLHGEFSEPFCSMITESRNLLKDLPVNVNRKLHGKPEASVLWFESSGKVPSLKSFKEVFGIDAAISCNDLIAKGFAEMSGAKLIDDNRQNSSDLIINDIDVSLLAAKSNDYFQAVLDYIYRSGLSDADRIIIAALPAHTTDNTKALCPPMPFVLFEHSETGSSDKQIIFPADAFDSGLFIPDAHALTELLIT